MVYNDWFFQEEGEVAKRSAEVVVPWVLEETGAQSVIDIGCGTGEWLAAAKARGCSVWGTDAHVPDHLLAIDSKSEFHRLDFTAEMPNCFAQLAICLEVAEHLRFDAGPKLVADLARSDAVLFSAATPGQPGIGHINCRPHDYWHGVFHAHGKTPEFIGDKFSEPVADFYRRNMFLYR